MNIISPFWSIREVFVVASRRIRADQTDWDTKNVLTTRFSTEQHFGVLRARPGSLGLGALAAGGLEITVVFLY